MGKKWFWINKRAKMKRKREKYDRKLSKNPIKKENNKRVAEAFKLRNKGKEFFVVLESEALLTLKTLKKYGIKRVEVPNPTSAFDKIKKYHNATYNMWLGDYFDMIKKEGKNKCGGIWFDYCCSIEGNNEVNPKSDIKKYFDYKLPANDSVLAFTFCYRKGTKVDYTHQDLYEIESYIQQVAWNNGYALVRIPYGRMYNGMFFGMYDVLKFHK